MRAKLAGCNECTHPTCQHSLTNLGVAQCFECDWGILVLDQTAAPKWKLACNRYGTASIHIVNTSRRLAVTVLKVTTVHHVARVDPFVTGMAADHDSFELIR